jgi:hypothetical protein
MGGLVSHIPARIGFRPTSQEDGGLIAFASQDSQRRWGCSWVNSWVNSWVDGRNLGFHWSCAAKKESLVGIRLDNDILRARYLIQAKALRK